MNLPDTHSADVDEGDSLAARMLREAIELCRHCYGYWRDERLWDDEHEIDYALDVDVLVMFSEPARHTAQIKTFTTHNVSSDHELQGLLARCLVNFIFFRFAPGKAYAELVRSPGASKTSFALLAPHDHEWSRVAAAIGAEAATDASAAMANVDALEGLDSLPAGDTAAVAGYLAEHASQVLDVLDGTAGASAQVTRLNALPAKKIVRLDRHPAFSGRLAHRVPPQAPSSDEAFLRLEEMAEAWYQSMLSLRDSGTRLKNIEDDAWALARLEWINRQAAEGGEKRRLVLISTTERLFKAGEKLQSFHDPSQTFAEAYIRHPLAFLGSRDFFASEKQSGHDEFRLREWLSVLFPNVVRQWRVVADSPRAFASQVDISLDEDGISSLLSKESDVVARALQVIREQGWRANQSAPFPEGALNEWIRVARNVSIRQDLSLSVSERSGSWSALVARLHEPAHPASMKTRLKDELARRVQASFLGLYQSIEVLSTAQALGESRQMRGVPALRFDVEGDGEVRDIYEELCRRLWQERIEQFDTHRLYARLADSDASNYRATVIHAFICAGSDLWFQTRTLCRIALLIVDHQLAQSERGGRTGREAAYLLCVAERRLANSIAGFEVAEAALKDALRRAGEAGRTDVRFRSEALALRVWRLQFARYVEKLANTIGAADALAIVTEAEEICCAVSPAADPPSVRSWVIRQSVSSASISALLAHAAGARSAQLVGAMRGVLARLRERELSPSLYPDEAGALRWRDEISDFIFLVATVIFDSDGRRIHAARSLLVKLQTQQAAKKAVSMRPSSAFVYEEARRSEFLRIAGIVD